MSPATSRRRGTPIALAVTTADHDEHPDDGVADRVLPPMVAGILGGVLAALAGWLLVAGLVVGGWLNARVGSLTEAIGVATQGWLAGHGAGLMLGGVRWTVIPLGLTAIFAVIIHAVAGFAARQHLAGRADVVASDRSRAALRATAHVAGSYILAVVVVALLVGTGDQTARVLIGSAILAGPVAWFGAARGVRHRWLSGLPHPWPVVLRATATAVAVVLVAGLGVLIGAIILHWDRVAELTASLDAGPVGTVLLWVLQAAFLPNAIVWCSSWVLGAGFTIGVDTVVSPALTDLGMLPAIPVLGALPAEGGGAVNPLVWLVGGALAGVIAALKVMRLRPHARFDETALIGGLAGVVAGLVFVALASITGGDLGTQHLVGVGPRLLELLVMSVGVLGISGLLGGLVIGLLRLRRTAHDEPADAEQ